MNFVRTLGAVTTFTLASVVNAYEPPHFSRPFQSLDPECKKQYIELDRRAAEVQERMQEQRERNPRDSQVDNVEEALRITGEIEMWRKRCLHSHSQYI